MALLSPQRFSAPRDTVGRVAARVGGFVRPGLDVVTGLGWTVVVGGVVCLVSGWMLGWFELRLLGFAALLVTALAAGFLVGRTRVIATVEVDPLRLGVGEAATGVVDVRSAARVPLMPTVFELPIGASAARFTLPVLTAGQFHEELFVVPTERRGVIAIGPLRSLRGDPLGIFRRTVSWHDELEVFVRPEMVALESLGAGFLRDLEGSTSQDLSASDLAFHALREYAPGDDLRHVHWRSSARAQKLLVRQYLDTRRSHVTLLVDPRPEAYQNAEGDFETAISVAASVCRQAILDEFETSFACGDQAVTGAPGSVVLDAFCRAELDPQTSLLEQGQRAALMAPGTSLVIAVTGRECDLRLLMEAVLPFPVDARRIGVIIDPAGDPGLREIEGLTLLTIARLAQLPAALNGLLS